MERLIADSRSREGLLPHRRSRGVSASEFRVRANPQRRRDVRSDSLRRRYAEPVLLRRLAGAFPGSGGGTYRSMVAKRPAAAAKGAGSSGMGGSNARLRRHESPGAE